MKDIIGFEGLYKVTPDGLIWSVRSSKYVKQVTERSGVNRVVLHNNGKKARKMVHRLVAEAFIPNPSNKPQVDHIDGNKQNNDVCNLRWCTDEENQLYRYKQGNLNNDSKSKSVKYGDDVFISIGALATHIATIRGSKKATVKKELKALNYGGKILYGKWCELL